MKMRAKLKDFCFRSLTLALIASAVAAQVSTADGRTRSSQRICSRTLAACDDCLSVVSEAPRVDDCCPTGGGCRSTTAPPVDPPAEDGDDQPGPSGCSCCVTITLSTQWVAHQPDTMPLLSVLTVGESRVADICHATEWVNMLLRPPCL